MASEKIPGRVKARIAMSQSPSRVTFRGLHRRRSTTLVLLLKNRLSMTMPRHQHRKIRDNMLWWEHAAVNLFVALEKLFNRRHAVSAAVAASPPFRSLVFQGIDLPFVGIHAGRRCIPSEVIIVCNLEKKKIQALVVGARRTAKLFSFLQRAYNNMRHNFTWLTRSSERRRRDNLVVER